MMRTRGTFFQAGLLAAVAAVSGCGRTYYGSGGAGFEQFPENTISPQEAISRAEPYLDETFELRTRNRGHVSDREPVVHVTLEGKYYYVVKDNYPSYSPGFYFRHAVKVDKNTGVVSPPVSGKR